MPGQGRVIINNAEAKNNTLWYEEAASSQQTWAINAATNLDYFFGNHWTPEQKAVLGERGQQPIAIQTIFQVVEQAVGMLTANKPSFRATPREGSDRKMAAVWSDLFQWMWTESRGQQRITNIIRDNYVQGRGVAHVYVDWDADYGKGEVLFKDLDPKEVFPDPRSTDPLWDDAAWVMTRQLFSKSQVAEIWGKDVADALPFHGYQRNSYPWSTSKDRTNSIPIHQYDVTGAFTFTREQEQYEIIERYEKVKRRHHRMFNPETSRDEILDEQKYEERLDDPAYIVTEAGVDKIVLDKDRIAAYDEMYNALGPVFHMVALPPVVDESGQYVPQNPVPTPGPEDASPDSIPGSTVAMQPVTVGELVANKTISSIPFMMTRVRVVCSCGMMLLYEPYDLPTEHFPIIPFPNISNRNPYPISDVDRLKDLQDLINKSQSLILAHLATSTNQKVFYPEGSIKDVAAVEQEWAKAGTAMIPYNPGFGTSAGSPGGVVIASLPPLPQALYANIDRAIALMERIAGIYAVQQGSPDAGQGTFRGVLAQDEMGLRRMKQKLDGAHASLERVGNVMKDYAQKIYTEEKVIRLVNPSGELVETTINQQFPQTTYDYQAERINDVTIGRYDMVIQAGSTLPQNRWSRFDNLMQMFDRGLVDDIAVLRGSDIEDTEEILERNSVLAQQRQALENYAQQLSEVQGDLQTAQREAQHANQRTELSKFQAKLAMLEADVKTNVRTFSIGLKETRKRVEAEETAAAKRQQPQ